MDEKVDHRRQAVPYFCKSAQWFFVDGEEGSKGGRGARSIM